jgi:hypothetical protein
VEDATTAQTIADGRTSVDRRALLEQVHAYAEAQKAQAEPREASPAPAPASAAATGPARETPAKPAAPDPVLGRVVDVCSGDPARVRRALHAREVAGTRSASAERRLVPHVVPLLADPVLARDAESFLRRAAPRSVGQLVDSLLDPGESPEVRLAVARILPEVKDAQQTRAFEGLWLALDDPSFALRRASAEAAVRLSSPTVPGPTGPAKAPPRERVHLQVESELARGDDVTPAARLEQVFTLLSLVHGRETMRSTLSGVLSDDTRQRGTALELLETLLPPALGRAVIGLVERSRGG